MIKWYLLFFVLFGVHGVYSQVEVSESYAWYCPPCGASCDDEAYSEEGRCEHCGMRLLKQTRAQHEMALKVQNMTIGFYLQDGVEVLDFAGPMEVFSYAGFNIVTISKTTDPIRSQRSLTVIPDYSIDDAPQVDIIATFGGNAARAFDEEVVQWMKTRQSDYYFSVCTGAFLLSKAGLLDGLKATTFHSAIDDLQDISPSTEVLRDVRFVDNGTVITTAGISAGIDGALHMVYKLLGPSAAERIAENMEYDRWVPDQGLVIKNQ